MSKEKSRFNLALNKNHFWRQLALLGRAVRLQKLLLIASCTLCITLLPAGAKTVAEQPTLVSIDFRDIIEGTVNYVQVSNISDEQEIEIGKQTNEQVLSEYPLHNDPQL